MTLKTALFNFMNEPVNDVGSNHRVAAISLKVECWLSFIALLLVPLFGVFIALMMLVGAAFAGEFIESFGWWDNSGEAGAAFGMLMFVGVLFATILATIIIGLWLWWANTTYINWNNTPATAVTMTNIFGAVVVLFSIGGVANLATGEFTGFTNILGLVLGILILVFTNLANSRGELDEASTVNTGAEAA